MQILHRLCAGVDVDEIDNGNGQTSTTTSEDAAPAVEKDSSSSGDAVLAHSHAATPRGMFMWKKAVGCTRLLAHLRLYASLLT